MNVFVPFPVLDMKPPVKLDFLRTGLGLLGAVYVMFRSSLGGRRPRSQRRAAS